MKRNEPSVPVFADWTVLPDESFSSTVTPGRPSSPFSTLPGMPPPGLKSRQTTPSMAPCAGRGSAA